MAFKPSFIASPPFQEYIMFCPNLGRLVLKQEYEKRKGIVTP